MDIILVCDVIAVLLALAVVCKTKKSEGTLLLAFFATTSYISYFIFATNAFVLWPVIFAVLIVMFGLLSLHHIVIVGYIAQLGIVGLNQLFDVAGYPVYIYGIFAFQLLAVGYGHNFDYYRDMFFSSSPNRRHKIEA